MIFDWTAGDRKVRVFALNQSFLTEFMDKQPPWGFGGLGYFTYKRTYARDLPGGGTEEWWQTCQRVVEGCFNIQKIHCRQQGLPWDESKAQASAQEMYRRMFTFKWSPPGRGLWMMGTDVVYERGAAALLNCAFTSSGQINDDFSFPFTFLMDLSMLGVGVGMDTRGAGKVKVQLPKLSETPFVVEDTREGWVDLLRVILDSFVGKGAFPKVIDYTKVRGRGIPLKTFGGIASGPRPLQDLVENLTNLLILQGVSAEFEVIEDTDKGTIETARVYMAGTGEPYKITSTHIVDIANYIGKAVVAGGIRRTAEVMFGEYADQDFVNLKQDLEAVKDRRWASNNSIFADVGMDYAPLIDSLNVNGEPGFCWIDNVRKFSRMNGVEDNKDRRVMGLNPCFSGDTLIAVADGRGAVPIRQLAEEGRDVPVYSTNKSGMVEIKWGRAPRLTRSNASLVEVVFDGGETLRVTPDHKMLLLNGTECAAKDLHPGDSLPRFSKYLETLSRGKKYLRVYCNTQDTTKDKVFEHRLIARFNDPENWHRTYDSAQKCGWLQGGVVVHHRDYNPINNHPDNLEILTFKAHQILHAATDRAGEKNGMWGKKQSLEARQKIGAKTRERCSDPVFLAKLSAAQTADIRDKASQRMSEEQHVRLLAYYKEQERTTDLETVWVDGNLYAVKQCEVCKTEMILPWRTRHQVTCSLSCHNKIQSFILKRKEGQKVAFAEKSRQTLHLQMMAFKDLQVKLGREPLKKEWEEVCQERGIPVRFQKEGETSNPYILHGYKQLQQMAGAYNHRVREIRFLSESEDVYNLTVADNHTVGVVTNFDPDTFECRGLFTFQCMEQPLESGEACNLVETYPAHHESYEDFKRTLKMAYLYAKTVTLVPTHIPRANAIMTRNRRIGCSMSGIVQAVQKLGRRQFLNWCDKGYDYIQELDRTYSDWLGIPLSIKTTTVKPSGTVSLLAGATPGIHYPHSPYYIRNVRVQDTSPLVEKCRAAGYPVEPDTYADNTVVVSFPVKEDHFVKGKGEVTLWEQFQNASDMQRYWSDNAVSVTVTFKNEERRDIEAVLEAFEDRLKGVSLLPLGDEDHGYIQAPYVAIDEGTYNAMMARITPLSLKDGNTHDRDSEDRFCTGDSCQLKIGK